MEQKQKTIAVKTLFFMGLSAECRLNVKFLLKRRWYSSYPKTN